ncbi:MAG TPA: thiol-disulfide isomerase, partial [Solibacterales bacterium]|nr:thiol-disulfide isomerase [Bryobacterales bacterium]
ASLHAAPPTFSHDVAPILYQHCVSCHHATDIAPMSLITYQEVKPWAAAIKEAVILRKMPPWKADP